jgi:uncharacterized protein
MLAIVFFNLLESDILYCKIMQLRRAINATRRHFAGVGGGAVRYETNNSDDPGRIKIEAVNTRIFLVNGLNYFGSVIALSHMALLWRPFIHDTVKRPELYAVENPEEIPVEAFTVFKYLQPTPELLLFGAGDFSNHPSQQVKDFLKSLGISIEVTNTVK